MDKKTFEDARSAWRMQFALETFKSVRAGMQAMLDRGFTVDLPEYYPLIVGLIAAITEAEAMVERSGERWWSAELHRLRGVFLAALGAEETQIEVSFCEAISTAREQFR